MSGSIAVPVKYDSSDEELYDLLGKLKGILFTGGGLELINPVTGEQHIYYKTAKKIFNYSMRLKDE